MSDNIYIGKKVESIESSPEFDSYAGIIINIDDETYVSAGDISGTTGRVLEVTNPYGTQAMAQNMLTMLTGFQYQPYSATRAIIDPAAELGDGVTVNGIYSGVYAISTTFSRLMNADISAPNEETIDHEYPYQTPTDKKIERQWLKTKSEFTIQATQIAAKVSKESPSGQTNFGWRLLDNSWTVFNQNGNILSATASGLEVTGKITATSGAIGGFNIGSNSIWNNISEYGGSQTYGVYLGTNGIQLGQNFKVDSAGNITASNVNISGAVNCSSLTVGGSAYVNFGGNTYSGGGVASGLGGGFNFNSISDGITSGSFGSAANWIRCRRAFVEDGMWFGSASSGGGTNAVHWNAFNPVTSVSLSKSYQGIVKMTNGSYFSCYNTSINYSTATIWYLGH